MPQALHGRVHEGARGLRGGGKRQRRQQAAAAEATAAGSSNSSCIGSSSTWFVLLTPGWFLVVDKLLSLCMHPTNHVVFLFSFLS